MIHEQNYQVFIQLNALLSELDLVGFVHVMLHLLQHTWIHFICYSVSAGREKLTCMPQQKSKNCKWIWLEEGVEEWAKKSVIGEEMLNCLYIITSN